MTDRNRLGKGLGAIFGEDVSDVLEEIQSGSHEAFGGVKTRLSVDDIRANPYQPRRVFDEEKLQELSNSIQQHGLFTPVLVRESTKGYELGAGERRLRATRFANLDEIDAIIVGFDDEQMMEIAIIENVQREDLNVLEEAKGYQSLIENLKLTQDQVAKRVNKSRSHITNILRLLKLPESVQMMVFEEKLTMGHVRPLVTLDNPKLIEKYAQEIYENKLSVREAEKLVKEKDEPKKTKQSRIKRKEYAYAERLFEGKLQTRTTIDDKRIVISFEDDDDLNRILDALDLIEE